VNNEVSFNNFLQSDLNKEQLKAVTIPSGAILVIAGAGSGKTRIITSRIANLIINESADPKTIVALTFTNKAAEEMKNRVTNFLNRKTDIPFVGTFHSFCLSLLRSNPSISPFAQFSILDEDDKSSLLKKILKKYNLEKQVSVAQLKSHISNLKNSQLSADDIKATPPMFQELYNEYEKEKNNIHCLDFDDLLLTILNIFHSNQEFKAKFQNKVKHILIDEYQDTNVIQHNLLKYMSLTNDKEVALTSICAVGDEDQSIYSWRGAVVENMLKFQDDFSPIVKVKIEQNYRTVEPILNAANKLISNNKIRNEKNLWSTKKAKNRILVLINKSDYQESDNITSTIKKFKENNPQKTLAILYRTHFQSRIIEEALINNKIPYQIIGGVQFYQRKEIKDLIAYLRLVVNPYDKVSFFRTINCPARGLGEQFENLAMEEWNNNPFFDFKELLQYILNNTSQPQKKAEAISHFLEIFKELKPKGKTSEIINDILEETDFYNHLRTAYETEDSMDKIDNVKELCRAIENFESKAQSAIQVYSLEDEAHNEINNTLEHFLAEIALIEEKASKQNQDENRIKMMTLHAAKGLEFDAILITGLEEGLFPSARSLYTGESLEEERRLFYVGMTRAKEWLILSWAKQRNTFGQISDQIESRFLGEIPETFLTKLNSYKETFYSTESHIKDFFEGKEISDKSNIFIQTLKTEYKSTYKKETKIFPSKVTSIWQTNQLVSHSSFGVGVVKKVEKKDSENFTLTVQFKNGEKKVLSSFLKKI